MTKCMKRSLRRRRTAYTESDIYKMFPRSLILPPDVRDDPILLRSQLHETIAEILLMRQCQEAHDHDLVATRHELAGLMSLFDIIAVDNPILVAALQHRRLVEPAIPVSNEPSDFQRATTEAAFADLPDFNLGD